MAGVALNFYDFMNDPNWQDGGQVALGVFAVVGDPWLALGAGIGLAGWEIYELYQEGRGSSGSSSGW